MHTILGHWCCNIHMVHEGAASIDIAGTLPFFFHDFFDTIVSWLEVSLGSGITIVVPPLARGPIFGTIILLVGVSLGSGTAIVVPLLARGQISELTVFGSTRIDVNSVGQMALSKGLALLGGVDPLGSTPHRVTPVIGMPSPVESLVLRGTVSDCSVSGSTHCGVNPDGRITPPTRLTLPVPALGTLSLLMAISCSWSEAIWACIARNSFSAFCFFDLPMVKPRGIEQ
jgi:hypothetical protein